MKKEKLLKYLCFLFVSIGILSFSSCGDENDEPKIDTENEVSNPTDPEGTQTATLVKNAGGISLLPNEALNGSSVWLDDNLNLHISPFSDGYKGNNISSVGAVKSLSEIKSLPVLGQTTTTIPKVGDGYIITYVGDAGPYGGLKNPSDNSIAYPKVRYVKMRISKTVTGIDGNVSGIEIKYCEWPEALDRKIEPLNNTLNSWRYNDYSGCRGNILFKNPVRCEVKSQPDFVKKVEIYDTHAIVYLMGAPGGWEGNLVLSNPSGDVTIKLDAISTDYTNN